MGRVSCRCKVTIDLPVPCPLNYGKRVTLDSDQHSVRKHSPGFVISAGTQVVLKVAKTLADGKQFRKPGAVGIVVDCPARVDGEYVIEFTDGGSVRAVFDELSLRRQEVDLELAGNSDTLRQHVIYRCQVGSKAYGLEHDASDDDIRGIFLPPARLHWSLYSIPEQLEHLEGGVDEVYWEIEKFVRLCLKANPNVLETLWTPIVLQATDLAQELRELRSSFLSQHLYKTYSGYVLSQFRRMKTSFERTQTFKTKHAMHLVRLLHSGIHAVRTGDILIEVRTHRSELLNIRDGKLSFEEVRARAFALDREFQDAFAGTSLPEQPDFRRIDDFLIRARRSVVHD